MTRVLLAYAPVYAIAALLFLAAALCGRLGRWHARRAAVVAEQAARPYSANVGTRTDRAAAIAHQAIHDGWTNPTEEQAA